MKNLLLFLLLYCLAVPSLSAQNNKWFMPGARWAVDFQSLFGPGTEYFELKNREMFQGVECARVRWYGIQTWTPSGIPQVLGNDDQFFYERNDSVFFWRNTKFELLYDFTRVPGDTLHSAGGYGQDLLVTDTGTALVQGVPLRFQKVKWEYPTSDTTFIFETTVYERIGGVHLIYPFIATPLTEIEYTLSCYRDDQLTAQGNCTSNIDFSYKPFPLGKGGWSEHTEIWCSFSGYQFKTEGDTLIPGLVYGKKLYYRPTYTGSYPCPTAYFAQLNEPWQVFGVVSQDFVSKKVFFTRLAYIQFPALMLTDSFPPLNEKRVMYDFDIQPGQQLAWKAQPNTVDHIDSVQIEDGTWRRRYFFQNEFGELMEQYYWLEGIGGSHGLFSPFINPYYLDVWQQLRCFKDNNVLKYTAVSPDECDLVVIPAHEPQHAESPVRAYPNPADGVVFLQLPEEVPAVDVEIRDLCGRLLGSRAGQTAGERLELPGAGMFLLQFRLPDGRVYAQRVVGQ